MEGILSQAEIDALLGGGADDDTSSSSDEFEMSSDATEEHLTGEEIDMMGEIGNISLGSSSTALSTLLGKNVSITTPKVLTKRRDEFKQELNNEEKLAVRIEYKKGFDGINMLIINKEDAAIIADLMMGNDGTNPPDDIDDLYMSAVGEAVNQMMGTSSTSMSGMLKKEIDIMPPEVRITNSDDIFSNSKFFDENEEIVLVIFDMEVEGLINTKIYQILSFDFVHKLTEDMYAATMPEEKIEKKEDIKQSAGNINADAGNMPNQNMGMYGNPQMMGGMNPQMGGNMGMYGNPQMMGGMNSQMGGNMGMYGNPQMMGGMNSQMGGQMNPQMGGMQNQYVNVQPVQFAPIGGMNYQQEMPSNIELIMDVPLEVTVELGRTKMQIKEILDLGAGSIVELDKLAGEPVNVLVNGRLIAKGEVVVIDESFGVRLTDIVSKMERLNKVQ